MGDRTGACRVFVGIPEGKSHLEGRELEGRVILRWICRSAMGAWTGLIWLRIGRALVNAVKCGEFLD
jgi:hypothetical protein